MQKMNKELLFLCAEDVRYKIRDIAKILKKSSQRLKYTLNLFEKEGILHNPHCIFDYSYLGLLLFRVYFKGGYIGEKDKNQIINTLKKNPHVVTIYEMSGEYDLIIEIIAKNPSRFNKELKNIVDVIPTLNNYKIALNIVTHLYPKSYLTDNSRLLSLQRQEVIVGGDRTIEVFDEAEKKIMQSLLLEPDITYSALAKKSAMNVKTAKSIFLNLKKRRIIKGYKYALGISKLNLFKFRLFLKLHNLSKEREDEFIGFMLLTKEVVQLNKIVGDWDVEVDIESFEKTRVREFITLMRERFKDIISSFNSIEFERYYKVSYLPKYIFEKENP